MGGKARLLDEKLLEQLYADSNTFDQQANDNVKQLKTQLSLLADRTMLQRLPDGQADTVKAAVERLDQAVESLKESIDRTRRFIDMKLTGAVSFSDRSADTARPLILSGHVKAFDGLAGLKK